MMLAAEAIHTYIRDTQAQIKAFNDQRTHHHDGFDTRRIPSASSDEDRPDTPRHAAQPRSE